MIDAKRYAVSEEVPAKIVNAVRTKKNKIMILEAIAVATFFLEFGFLLRHRWVVLFVDNEPVKWAGVKGYSKNQELTEWMHCILARCNVQDLRVWFHWISTDYNPSDGFSRPLEFQNFDQLFVDMNAERFYLRIPESPAH